MSSFGAIKLFFVSCTCSITYGSHFAAVFDIKESWCIPFLLKMLIIWPFAGLFCTSLLFDLFCFIVKVPCSVAIYEAITAFTQVSRKSRQCLRKQHYFFAKCISTELKFWTYFFYLSTFLMRKRCLLNSYALASALCLWDFGWHRRMVRFTWAYALLCWSWECIRASLRFIYLVTSSLHLYTTMLYVHIFDLVENAAYYCTPEPDWPVWFLFIASWIYCSCVTNKSVFLCSLRVPLSRALWQNSGWSSTFTAPSCIFCAWEMSKVPVSLESIFR